jgi:tetratricopeptide (TPR) repeat protein
VTNVSDQKIVEYTLGCATGSQAKIKIVKVLPAKPTALTPGWHESVATIDNPEETIFQCVVKRKAKVVVIEVHFDDGKTWHIPEAQVQRDTELPEFKTLAVLLQKGRPAEVEQLLDKADWRSSNEIFEVGDSSTSAYAFYSPLLLDAYIRMNDYADAERLAKDGVNWSEERYGADTLEVATFVEALANLNRLESKYDEAEPLYARSLSIRRIRKFDGCSLAHESYAGLAEAYLAMKRPDDAIQLLRPIIEKCKDKPVRADLLNVYSIALEDLGRPDDASNAEQEAERIGFISPRFQQEDRDLLRARLLAVQGHFEEAGALCQKWIAIFEVPNGPQPDRLVIPLEQYARILRVAGREKEAEQIDARLAEIRAK